MYLPSITSLWKVCKSKWKR